MRRRWYAVSIAIVATVLAACARGGTANEVETFAIPSPAAPEATAVQTPAEPVTPPVPTTGDPILVLTRITDARAHTGKILNGSFLGDASFCEGAKTSGGSTGAAITSTFHCADGTVTVQYAPMQRSLSQGAVWSIVEGTGSYKGLWGGGSMAVTFSEDNPDIGHEYFVGLVNR